MTYEAIMSVLAATAVFALLWWLIIRLTRPLPGGPLYMAALPHDADAMQCAVMQMDWLRRQGFDVRLLIVTDELDSEGLRMARLLAKDDKAVTFGKMEDLGTYDGGKAIRGNTIGHLQ